METKPAQAGKAEARKMVPEADLIAVKRGALEENRRLKEELAKTKDALTEIKSQLKIAKVNVDDDDEVKKVRAYLLEEAEKVKADREKLDGDLTSLRKREREAGAKELASKYGVEVDSLLEEETLEGMKIKALEKHAEIMAQEKEEKEAEKQSSESVYERQPAAIVKKQPKDMTEEEFTSHVKSLKQEALTKK